jgi:hypothetical protein
VKATCIRRRVGDPALAWSQRLEIGGAAAESRRCAIYETIFLRHPDPWDTQVPACVSTDRSATQRTCPSYGDCQIHQNPAMVMARPWSPRPAQNIRQLAGQRDAIRQIRQQPRPGMRHHTPPISRDHDPGTSHCSLHLESTLSTRDFDPSANPIFRGSRALSLIQPRTRRQDHEESGLTGKACAAMIRPEVLAHDSTSRAGDYLLFWRPS